MAILEKKFDSCIVTVAEMNRYEDRAAHQQHPDHVCRSHVCARVMILSTQPHAKAFFGNWNHKMATCGAQVQQHGRSRHC